MRLGTTTLGPTTPWSWRRFRSFRRFVTGTGSGRALRRSTYSSTSTRPSRPSRASRRWSRLTAKRRNWTPCFGRTSSVALAPSHSAPIVAASRAWRNSRGLTRRRAGHVPVLSFTMIALIAVSAFTVRFALLARSALWERPTSSLSLNRPVVLLFTYRASRPVLMREHGDARILSPEVTNGDERLLTFSTADLDHFVDHVHNLESFRPALPTGFWHRQVSRFVAGGSTAGRALPPRSFAREP